MAGGGPQLKAGRAWSAEGRACQAVLSIAIRADWRLLVSGTHAKFDRRIQAQPTPTMGRYVAVMR